VKSAANFERLTIYGGITAGPHGGGLWSDEEGPLRSSDGSFSVSKSTPTFCLDEIGNEFGMR
jgi:hypothetical protein